MKTSLFKKHQTTKPSGEFFGHVYPDVDSSGIVLDSPVKWEPLPLLPLPYSVGLRVIPEVHFYTTFENLVVSFLF